MKCRHFRSGFVVVASLAAGLLLTVGVQAQDSKPATSAATPRTADGKPDLSGMWGGRGGGGDAGGGAVATKDGLWG